MNKKVTVLRSAKSKIIGLGIGIILGILLMVAMGYSADWVLVFATVVVIIGFLVIWRNTARDLHKLSSR